ncbi:MAG: hypothetical protein MN733_42780 [Nitrososphaera sp.]|nr:hypothetical protein [Nitrososphaera sp.]
MTSSIGWLAPARIVFSSKGYLCLAVVVTSVSWITFNFLDGLLLFSPVLNFYYPLPEDAVLGFIVSTITAPLLGVVTSMNIFLINSRSKAGKSSFVSGSALGTITSVCTGCSSVGFYIASTFGIAGVAASSFLSNYQIPLRLIALALLVVSYYYAHRRIVMSCRKSV